MLLRLDEAPQRYASRVRIEDMDESFTVTRPMLISLCDAVVAGSLPPQELRTIGSALESSDKFEWDGDADELVADVIADWSCPEIKHPLTGDTVAGFRASLTRTETYPTQPTQHAHPAGTTIHQTQRQSR